MFIRASFAFQQVMVVCVCNVNLRMTSSGVFSTAIYTGLISSIMTQHSLVFGVCCRNVQQYYIYPEHHSIFSVVIPTQENNVLVNVHTTEYSLQDIQQLPWPTQSPNLCPTEHMEYDGMISDSFS